MNELRNAMFAALGLRAADVALRALTVATDAVPAKYRFGHWNRLLAALALRGGLPIVEKRAAGERRLGAAVATEAGEPMSCMILAGDLDTGGIETVVATLAPGLASMGFDVEVVCSSGGRVQRMLENDGLHVSFVSHDRVGEHIAHRRPDVVQLHRLDPTLMRSLAPWRSRTVPVFHAMESYLTPAVWGEVTRMLHDAPASVAVSTSVRDYFEERTGATALVVENGVPPAETIDEQQHATARAAIGRALGREFGGEDVIVLGLQRFSEQKNPTGLVDAFLLAAEQDPRLQLVVAGAPNSWLEVRRADIIRRRHPNGDRVHFLGDSDSSTLFQGADVFALDSFSEGGPIAAVEAIAHGLPIVVTEVGFARELVDVCGPRGVLVVRANEDVSESAMARQRRMRHQRNRRAFSEGILRVAAHSVRATQGVPERFTEKNMVRRHADILRSVGSRI
ncbi:glycosyltransferase [Microbacterium sp. YMB-B2]|uniref:Glycosyltransferase n=1 Tax=Microbacterium tenebrionis TaxID=2830665 RepID=A0A9X1LQ01_9MICO|nr:glycosyltransferase [Microbacterium tenebrionis]MCC2029646.1 glycosyltransferase [Microbacterium tenebrionis]